MAYTQASWAFGSKYQLNILLMKTSRLLNGGPSVLGRKLSPVAAVLGGTLVLGSACSVSGTASEVTGITVGVSDTDSPEPNQDTGADPSATSDAVDSTASPDGSGDGGESSEGSTSTTTGLDTGSTGGEYCEEASPMDVRFKVVALYDGPEKGVPLDEVPVICVGAGVTPVDGALSAQLPPVCREDSDYPVDFSDATDPIVANVISEAMSHCDALQPDDVMGLEAIVDNGQINTYAAAECFTIDTPIPYGNVSGDCEAEVPPLHATPIETGDLMCESACAMGAPVEAPEMALPEGASKEDCKEYVPTNHVHNVDRDRTDNKYYYDVDRVLMDGLLDDQTGCEAAGLVNVTWKMSEAGDLVDPTLQDLSKRSVFSAFNLEDGDRLTEVGEWTRGVGMVDGPYDITTLSGLSSAYENMSKNADGMQGLMLGHVSAEGVQGETYIRILDESTAQ